MGKYFPFQEYVYYLLYQSQGWLNSFPCVNMQWWKMYLSLTSMWICACISIKTHWAFKKLDTAKVSQLDVSIIIQEDVAAFDVTVDDLSTMEILQTLQHLSGVPPGPHLIQFSLLLQYISQWPLHRCSHGECYIHHTWLIRCHHYWCITWWHVHSDGIYRVMLRIVKAGCHPVATARVVEHWQLKSEALGSIQGGCRFFTVL